MTWRRGLALAGLVVVLGCPEPSDTLFTPVHEPLEVGVGLFQVTFSTFPEYSRGFTPAGDTILFNALRLEGAGTAWEMLGANVDGSAAREEAALYRKAIRPRLAALSVRPHDRVYTYWMAGNSGDFFGPAACPRGRVRSPRGTWASCRCPPRTVPRCPRSRRATSVCRSPTP